MATNKTTDEDLQLFTAEDPYFFTVDNRPLRRIQENVVAVNTQLDAIAGGDCEIFQFIFENPSVENIAGGIVPSREGGKVVRVSLSVGTAGSSGNFETDVKVNGTTIYTTSANRPVLAFNDSDKVTISTAPNIEAPNVPADGRISVDTLQIQAGSPRWFRVTVWVRKPHTIADGF